MKIITYNLIIFFTLILFGEIALGYWFTNDNFGIHMRDQRNINWKTVSNFNNKEYNFYYKRNFYGFRGEEFDPSQVKIIFQGGSTANQRFTPEEFTIVGRLNEKFTKDKINIKIFNAGMDGKSLRGIIYDFNYWFTKINNLKPEYTIFYLGINETTLARDLDEKIFDIHYHKKKFDKFKDYLKNNSFIYSKYKAVSNKYFPRETKGYFINSEKLYEAFKYIDYNEAKKIDRKISTNDNKILIQLEQRLVVLKKILDERKIKPVIITQVEFDGLNDQRLFLVNEKLKEFSIKNNIPIIKLDEIIKMEINDFYDNVHTTPEGSSKIADKIYIHLRKILANQ